MINIQAVVVSYESKITVDNREVTFRKGKRAWVDNNLHIKKILIL